MTGRFSMRYPLPIWGVLLLTFSLTSSHPVCAEEIKSTSKSSAFDRSKVLQIHLEFTAAEFNAIAPAFVGGFGPPPKKEAAKEQPKRESEKNLFGTDFPWVQANFTADGKTLKKVGVRYTGEMSYFSSMQNLKKPLKIAFNKFEKQTYGEVSSVNLLAMPMDGSKSRAALAYAVFQAIDVPAPYTSFAEVTLTVPGKYDREILGLYAMVENVDSQFLKSHFQNDQGLLMKPARMRGIDYLGEEWNPYPAQYQPTRAVTKDESIRLMAFAKLINQSTDDEFKSQIDSYLDVDEFLRFMAASSFIAHMDGFNSIGWNYSLYLDPKSNKFLFIPGDLENTFGSFSFLATLDQQMDLSFLKPYPGENKLTDRLLAIKDLNAKYRKLLKDLSTTVFSKEQLLKEAETIDKLTRTTRDQESKAVAARREPAPGFGPPGGGGMGPQTIDLKTFIEKRTSSLEAQLAGKSKGFVPQPFAIGPPPGGGAAANNQAIDSKTFRDEVKVAPEFEATLFGIPPKVNYPVAIACEPNGAVYVAVDEQGSLGRTPGGGKILRCVDQDGDGKADVVTVFAKVDHPRGIAYRNGKVWVMHPPTLSVFEDTNGDGVSDKQVELVTGLTTNQIADRGGDHTTNGVRLGIDGWLYIAVGDYGIKLAKGKDGRTITLRGGGIVRVRPDGTELEIYCTGLRNPFDLAIDGFMNVFTRDNTNDGAGWDTRVSLLKQSALYGYTQLFANFTDEIMPTLGVFGSGGATGGLYVQDSRWPVGYRDTLFTGDWGRSEVYRHELKTNGATFDLKQESFMKMPRATGMDIDGSGRLYVASWRNGSAVGFEGPNIGFVARVTPKNFKAEPFPDLKSCDTAQLVKLLASPQSVSRLHAQGEIIARGRNVEVHKSLISLASDTNTLLEGRAAAIFTLKQIEGTDSHPDLIKLVNTQAVSEFALRALTDRTTEFIGLDAATFVTALKNDSPRVRAQALISLGRLGQKSVAKNILPLTSRQDGSTMPTEKPLQNQPDPGRVVPHLAVRALVAMNAIDECLEALDGPHAAGALWAMRYMHDPKAVEGLIQKLGTNRSPELRRDILITLIRLYNREADYTGSWWGIRPDNTGPYYDRVQWAMSDRIGNVVTAAILDADKETALVLKTELTRHRVTFAGVTAIPETVVVEKPLVLPKADPKDASQIANMPVETAHRRTSEKKGDAKLGEQLFKSQSCIACHTTADGQTPKGPHLASIGKRYKTDELIESILKPSAKLAQGFESYRFETSDGRAVTGFVVGERADATIIRESNGVRRELKKTQIESRTILKVSAMPEGLAANLTPEQLADLIAYLESLK